VTDLEALYTTALHAAVLERGHVYSLLDFKLLSG